MDINLDPPRGWLPAQREATRLVEDPDGPLMVLLSGGMGSGKSYWLAVQGFRLHFAHVRWCLERGIPPAEVRGILLVPTYQLLERAMRPTFYEAAYDLGLHDFVKWKKADSLLQITVGGQDYGQIMAFTAEAPERIISANAAYGLVDEPGTPKVGDAWGRIPGRLRTGNPRLRKVAQSGTPEDIVSRAWFYDAMASPEAVLQYGAEGDNTRRIVFASTLDNRHIDGLEEYVRGMRQVYTPQQQAAYIEGRFVAMAVGRAYAAFVDRLIDLGGHLLPAGHEWTQPVDGAPLLVSWDFNTDPMCGVVARPKGEDGLVVVDEVRIPNAGTDGTPAITAAAREFCARWAGRLKGPLFVHGDATETRRWASASYTGWRLMHNALRQFAADQGVEYVNRVPASNPREIDRVNTVNAALENGHLYVAEGCAHLRRDLNLVGFKEGTNQLDKSDASLTHLSDALGYAVMGRSRIRAVRTEAKLPAIVTARSRGFAAQCDW